MAAPSITDFRSEFPEFSSVQDADITNVINRAYGLHSATNRGTLYAAAHLYSLDREKNDDLSADGGAGVVTQESIGSRSVSYSTTAGMDANKVFWSRSPYGREFLQIEQRNSRQGVGIMIA